MKNLFDWYITKYPINANAIKELDGVEYLGKEDYFYIAHGRILDKSEPSGSARWRTSVIRKLEFIPESNLLHIHTLNSIYVCNVDACRRNKQAPFDVLPEPVRAIAAAGIKPFINAPEEPNTILLAFDEGDSNLNFVGAAYNRDGYTSHLSAYPHLGMFVDSMLLYDESPGASEIDIRYYPGANIEFYYFDTDGLSVYLYNVGATAMTFKTPVGNIELAPGEKKMYPRKMLLPRMKRKYWHKRKHCCRSCPVYWVKINSEAFWGC